MASRLAIVCRLFLLFSVQKQPNDAPNDAPRRRYEDEVGVDGAREVLSVAMAVLPDAKNCRNLLCSNPALTYKRSL